MMSWPYAWFNSFSSWMFNMLPNYGPTKEIIVGDPASSCNVEFTSSTRVSDSNEYYNITNDFESTALTIRDLEYIVEIMYPTDGNRYDLSNFTRNSFDIRMTSKFQFGSYSIFGFLTFSNLRADELYYVK